MKNELIKRRVAGKVYYMDTYLMSLNKLLMRNVSVNDLISVDDTDAFLRIHPTVVVSTQTFDFNDKEAVLQYAHSVIAHWNAPCYIGLDHFRNCGMFLMGSLNEFNWDFRFDDEPYGMIYLFPTDCPEGYILDFYEESGGIYLDFIVRHPPQSRG